MNNERPEKSFETVREEIVREIVAQDIRSEAQKKERARRRRKRKRMWNRFKSFVFWGILVCFFIYLFRSNFGYPIKTVSNETIFRDLTNSTMGIPELPQEERLSAWESELPKFVEKDIAEARKKSYDIRYTIGDVVLKITVRESDDEVVLRIFDSIYSTAFISDSFTDFSIYQQENEIHLYGCSGGELFTHFIFYQGLGKYPDYEALTYDLDVPFNNKDKGIGTLDLKDYSLYYDEETQTFLFYSKGEVVSSKVFFDSIEEIQLYNGIIITKNHMLYKIFAYLKDGVPELKFVYVDDGVELVVSKGYAFYSYLAPADKESSILPILKKDEDYYVMVPSNWEDSQRYSLRVSELSPYDRETDYGATLMPIKDLFISAEFDYMPFSWGGEWIVDITFNINGKVYSTDEYIFYGYDERINLSDADAEKLSVKVNSIDEIEEQIGRIREVYQNYY